jgi:hypothetical protein
MRQIVRCGTHGTRTSAVVCRHIVEASDKVVGFVENSSDPDDLQAWCNECEGFFATEGAMTERFKAFHGHLIVCDFCYAAFKIRHSLDSAAT